MNAQIILNIISAIVIIVGLAVAIFDNPKKV